MRNGAPAELLATLYACLGEGDRILASFREEQERLREEAARAGDEASEEGDEAPERLAA